MHSSPLFFLCFVCFVVPRESAIFSSSLVHRFSDEARVASAAFSGRVAGLWPARRSLEYYNVLKRSDRLRQRRRLGGAKYSLLYPAEGSETLSPGNDFGWLHYTWIDIGTPNVSFLVALDAGSDLFWVPCDCIQCAPLSGYHGSLDKDLGMYNPDESKTSTHLSCSHELCTLGGSCKNSKQPCPYTVNYYSENTSTSGLLIEDTMYLVKSDDHVSIQAPVVIGCGRKQSGGYLDGIAPDGLLGLGLGEVSVPSILARAGLVPNSFSMCFRGDDSGEIFFGDQGLSTQSTTPFVALDGKYITYIIGVDNFCVGTRCLGKTNFQALVDSGSSFTFLPDEIYRRVTMEFDKQIHASRLDYKDSPWEYCYTANSLEMPRVPAISLTFSGESFEVTTPTFSVYNKEEDELAGFCIALQSSAESIGTIGQNLMTGYLMVFDRENLWLGWSRSNCNIPGSSTRVPLTSPPHGKTTNQQPTNQQHSSPKPDGREVKPAIAGRAPTPASEASPSGYPLFFPLFLLLSQFFRIFSCTT